MHVLFLPKWYPGRNDPQLGDFIRKQALAVAGCTKTSTLFVTMLEDPGDAPFQEVNEADGLWELRCYFKRSTAQPVALRKLVNALRYWRAAMTAWQRVVRERGLPDLLHVHIMVRPALIAWWLRTWRSIPFLISEQSSEYLDGSWADKGLLFKAINFHLFRRAARVTAVSEALGSAMVHLGLCSRYEVVPNVVPGMDLPLPPKGLPGSFLVVADLVDRTKNVSGVLRALSAARRERDDLRLDVIGDGVDAPMLKALAHQLGLNGSVWFHGRMSQPEVMGHMARTGAVIINSNVETFSVVTGEALALGRPVIATRCGGPVAFINEVNGTLIAPRDEDALRQAMLDMAGATRYEPSAIRATVSDGFSAQAVGSSFLRIYNDILDHARR